MSRPAEYEISTLISENRLEEAKAKLRQAVTKGGSMSGAAKLIGCSNRQVWRWAETLGVSSFYSGEQGGYARWAK